VDGIQDKKTHPEENEKKGRGRIPDKIPRPEDLTKTGADGIQEKKTRPEENKKKDAGSRIRSRARKI